MMEDLNWNKSYMKKIDFIHSCFYKYIVYINYELHN